MRQIDVEPERLRADVESAAVGGFHHPGPSAGHDHHLAIFGLFACLADQPPELARDLVIMALGENALGDREPAGDCFLTRSGGLRRAQGFHVPARRPRLANSRAAEHHDRMADTVLVEQGFRFEVFELQPQAAGLVATQKFGIRLGQPVGRTFQNPLHPPQSLGILLGRLGPLPWQRLPAPMRVGRARDAEVRRSRCFGHGWRTAFLRGESSFLASRPRWRRSTKQAAIWLLPEPKQDIKHFPHNWTGRKQAAAPGGRACGNGSQCVSISRPISSHG